jgi:Icc-related predicted phosphoesterase
VRGLILLAISDIHDRVKQISRVASEIDSLGIRVDATIVAGDLTYFKGAQTAKRILVELKEKLKSEYVLFVPGNCDDPATLNISEINHGITNIHGNVAQIGIYVLYGVGGGGISPFNTLIEFSEEELRKYINYIREVHGDMSNTIIVTHQPIYGFFDDVNGLNIGSKAFREFLDKHQPLLWITGHVHENSGYTVSGKTTIIHPGPLMHGQYALVKLDDKTPRVLEVGIYKLK